MSYSRSDMEQLAFVATVFGFDTCLVIGLLFNSRLYELRGNAQVFWALVLGSLASPFYYLFFMLGRIYGWQNLPGSLGAVYWLAFITYTSLYIILVERLMPIMPVSWTHNSVRQRIFEIGLPFVLSLPQIIASALMSSSLGFLPVANNLGIATMMFAFLSENFLTYSFLKSLLQNRKASTLLDIMKSNKKEWFIVLLTGGLNLAVNLTKIAELLFGAKLSVWGALFYNLGTSVIVLISFYNFIFVTKTVTKKVLATNIQINDTKSTKTAFTSEKKPEAVA